MANSTRFKPGVSGNPKGRPPGIRETKPRGDRLEHLVRDIVNVAETDPAGLQRALLRVLRGQDRCTRSCSWPGSPTG